MKKVRKILPLSIYDIPGMERWLEEQADAGLFPVMVDAWATFTPTGVPGTRFRLEPWGREGAEPSAEQLEFYRSAGWEYALTIGRAYYLFYTTDPAAPELYSDRQSRGLSLERLEKRALRYRRIQTAIWVCIGALLVWAMFFHRSEFDVQPAPFARVPLLLLSLFAPGLLLLLISAVFSWRTARRDLRTLRRTCRALKEGLPPPPSPGPSRRIAAEYIFGLVLIVPLLLVVVFQRLGPWEEIPLDRFDRPYVALQELEREEVVSYGELTGEQSSFHEDENQGQLHVSLLAPTWYEVSQDGYATAEGDYRGYSPYPEGEDRFALCYAPNLDTACFHLLFPFLARPVAEAQLDVFRLVNVTWSYTEATFPGLDFVILADEPDGIWQMAALGKGGNVAVFRYAGREDLSGHLETLAALVLE